MPKVKNYLLESGISDEAYDFMESAKLTEYGIHDFVNRLPAVMTSAYYMDKITGHSPELGFCERFPLETSLSDGHPLMAVQRKRISTRKFSEKGINFRELSDFLNLSYCITGKDENSKLAPHRNIATAGGLYPVDVYVIVRNVTGLERGVYFYNIFERCLELVSDNKTEEETEELITRTFFTNNQESIDHEHAAGYILLGATLNRSCFKYQDRGIWFAFLDAGAIMHAVYLAAAAMGFGCCALGGYIDNMAMKLIGYEGNSQGVLGTLVFGKITEK